ncbi:GntR family transcriptional regulator [Alkalibacter rhizosphaerae]|uniref:GntR family transcriptional regulator n=1 Tax=Alkalibacter rhizosphaerae TaxID=2815577 RepID=A0A974XGY7_9FIRM|nr:GntR family transcriptional regulator [Alkalibacter rhizosphaerae]
MEHFLKIDMDTYKPLREIVFTTMREAIVNGDFKPGQRLMEVQLAEQMGVSRTPVREAIRKLELEGLVIMVPRKGAYVAGLSSEDVKEVLEIRAVLEGLAASLAAKNAGEEEVSTLREIVDKFKQAASDQDVVKLIHFDSEFHDVMYRASKNKKLIQLISSLREQVQRFRVAYFTKIKNTEILIAEHNELLEAIANNDSEKARIVAETHIATTERLITSIEDRSKSE